MVAEIIAVGTELLLGDIVNTNAQYLSKELAAMGFSVYFQSVVGDNKARMVEVIELAKSRSDLVVLTGGLGPTDDDMTKEVTCEVFKDRLEMDTEELKKIQNFFASIGRPMTKNNQKQAMCPVFGDKLNNDVGTAPGAVFYDKVTDVMAAVLPGPPSEMKWVFEHSLRPKLQSMQGGVIVSQMLRVYGIGESELEPKIQTFLQGANPTVALYAKTQQVAIRVTAKANTHSEAVSLINVTEKRLRTVLGDHIYGVGETTLERTLVTLLREKLLTVATAESCTGGMLSQRITSVDGASDIFDYGICSYANEVKSRELGIHKKLIDRYGAVSGQVAGEMARSVAVAGNADIGVGITGIAGPGGGTPEKPVGLVYVAVSYKKLTFVKKLNVGNTRGRNFVRLYAVNTALDLVRRIVCDMELNAVRVFDRREICDFEAAAHDTKRFNGGRIVKLILAVLVAAGLGVGGYFGYNYLVASGFDFTSLMFWQNISTGIYPAFPEKPSQGSDGYAGAVQSHMTTLAATNPDTVGWLSVDGTDIEIPIVQGEDNTHYTVTGFDGEPLIGGTAFLDARNVDTDQPQTLHIYGGSNTFAQLSQLTSQQRAQQVQHFSYITPENERVYQIVSVMYNDSNEPMQPDLTAVGEFESLRQQLEFAVGIKSRSLYNYPVETAEGDSYMCLVTDSDISSGVQLIVVGRQLKDGEVPTSYEPEANTTVIHPDIVYQREGGARPDTDLTLLRLANNIGSLGASDVVGFLPTDIPQLPNIPVTTAEQGGDSTAASSSQSGNSDDDSSSDNDISGSLSQSSSASSSSDNTSSSSAPSDTSSSASESSTPPSSSTPQSSAPSSTAPSSSTTPTPTPEPTGATLTVTMNGAVTTDSAVNILSQIVAAEMSSGWPVEALKAQAVAAHSWILNQQAAGNPAPSVVGRTAAQSVINAVSEVAHLKMTYGGAAAFTPYFASSAGRTNGSHEVWGGTVPYLVSVDSSVDAAAPGYTGTVTKSAAEIAAMVLATTGIQLTGDPSTWFTVVDHTSGGYNGNMTIGGQSSYNGKAITGRAIRDTILAGAGLRSAAFDITTTTDSITFTTRGYGHGVGMSQWGAYFYAGEHGYSYAQILNHYYPGVTIG